MTIRHFLICIAGIILASAIGCSESNSGVTSASARRLPVEVLTARAVDSYSEARMYAGTIQARQTSELAFPRVGKLVQILVDEGTTVKRGQLLARLDIRELDQQKLELQATRDAAQALLAELKSGPRKETIAAMRSSLADLESQVTLANATFDRVKSLRKRGASTQQQLDDASSRVDSIAARRRATALQLEELTTGTRIEQITAQAAVVTQIEAQLQALSLRTEDSHITAPFDGTIAGRHIDTGSTVQPGQQILTIVESQHLEAKIGLPGSLASSLDTDAAYSFLWRDSSASGQFKAILPQVDPRTRNQTVVFEIDSTGDTSPLPGDIIRLQVNKNIKSRGFWLPLSALTKGTRGLWSVFIVNRGDKTSSNTVDTAALEVIYTDGARAFVRGTLKDGDRVVASGSHRIVAGQQVQPVEQSP